jgi:hypothetical protein
MGQQAKQRSGHATEKSWETPGVGTLNANDRMAAMKAGPLKVIP